MSDELKLARALKTRPSREESAEFLSKLSGVKEEVSGALGQVAPYVVAALPEIIGGTIGGIGAAGLQYASSKPGASGKSKSQELLERAVSSSQSAVDEETKAHGKPSFETQSAHIRNRAMKEQADLSVSDPGKAALRAIPKGVMTGVTAAKVYRWISSTLKEKK